MAQFPDTRESRRGHRRRADRVRIVMATAFLGPRGSFSEEAALLRADTDQLVAFSSFPALVSAVETGLADEAVLPIENSIEGSVSAGVFSIAACRVSSRRPRSPPRARSKTWPKETTTIGLGSVRRARPSYMEVRSSLTIFRMCIPT